MTMPLAKLDILAGYSIGFSLMAAVQATVASAVAFVLLDLTIAGSAWQVVVLAVLNAILGMALGLFMSAFANSEFQAVQFMPAFLLPQILLCGLIADRDTMAEPLQWLSDVLPMTYAYEALHRVAADGQLGRRGALDVLVVIGFAVLALLLGAATLRRRTD